MAVCPGLPPARSPHCVCGGAPWPRAAGPPAPALVAHPAGAAGQGLSGQPGEGQVGGVLPGAGPPWLPALGVISLSLNLCLQHPKWTHQNEKGNRKQRQPLWWLGKVTPAAPFPPWGPCPPTLPSQLCAYTARREGTTAWLPSLCGAGGPSAFQAGRRRTGAVVGRERLWMCCVFELCVVSMWSVCVGSLCGVRVYVCGLRAVCASACGLRAPCASACGLRVLCVHLHVPAVQCLWAGDTARRPQLRQPRGRVCVPAGAGAEQRGLGAGPGRPAARGGGAVLSSWVHAR